MESPQVELQSSFRAARGKHRPVDRPRSAGRGARTFDNLDDDAVPEVGRAGEGVAAP
jgi:hypothetical protein